MSGISVTGIAKVTADLRTAAKELNGCQERAVAKGGLLVTRQLKTLMSGPPTNDAFWGRGGASGQTLGARTGETRNRIQGGQVLRSGNTVFTTVGSPDAYMKHHEEGKKLTTAGYFRIPTAAAMTGSGVDRLAGASIKGQPGFRLIRTKAGKLWGVHENYTKRGSFRSVTFMYLFVKSITLKPRHIFAQTMKTVEPQLARLCGADVAAVVRMVGGRI